MTLVILSLFIVKIIASFLIRYNSCCGCDSIFIDDLAMIVIVVATVEIIFTVVVANV